MSKKLHVAVSPLTNTIFAGHILKDGRTWAANKQDVTNEVVCAFVDHALAHKRKTGDDITLSIDGKVAIAIVVTDLTQVTDEK